MNLMQKFLLFFFLGAVFAARVPAQDLQKDYLSPQEADKIRDAYDTNDKI